MTPIPLTDTDKQVYIRTFLLEWMGWVDHGAQEPHYVFNRGEGLCKLINKWARRKEFTNPQISQLGRELWLALEREHVPFNRTAYNNFDQLSYMEEFEQYRMHENPLRKKWVQDYLRRTQ